MAHAAPRAEWYAASTATQRSTPSLLGSAYAQRTPKRSAAGRHELERGAGTRCDESFETLGYALAGDVRGDDARLCRQLGRERRDRGVERVAMHGAAAAHEPAVRERRPLDARVADVDEHRHRPLRTLTSPATTRRRSPASVSTSSAPSLSMPSAVPKTRPGRLVEAHGTAAQEIGGPPLGAIRGEALRGIVGEQRGELVDERGREHGSRRRRLARAPS